MYLQDHGHTALTPALPDDDFDAAVHIAQAVYDQHHLAVVVGRPCGPAPRRQSSRKSLTTAGLLKFLVYGCPPRRT
jgi:hypothetical protein